jgi:hypothetical protein
MIYWGRILTLDMITAGHPLTDFANAKERTTLLMTRDTSVFSRS